MKQEQLLDLFGNDKGIQDVADARQWIADNPTAYMALVDMADTFAEANGYQKNSVSMRGLVGWLRMAHHVSVKNAITPALARIIEKEFPHLDGIFRKTNANADDAV